MGEIKNLAQLINQVEKGRTEFEARIKLIKEEDFLIDGIWGEWSLKDLLAHIVTWENEMILWIEQILNTQEIPGYLLPGFSNKDVDDFNFRVYLKNKDRDLQEIMSEFTENHQKVMSFIASQDEDTLFSENRFKLRDDWLLWYVIGANTFWHYDEHLTDLDNLHKKENNQ